MEEFLPPVPHELIQAERRNQEVVFGRERLQADRADRAPIELTQEFVSIIDSACAESGVKNCFNGDFRSLPADHDGRHHLISNRGTAPQATAGVDEVDLARAGITNLAQEQHYDKPKGMPVGRYLAHEMLYVDAHSGEALVKRRLATTWALGRHATREAVKPASATDIEAAINIVVKALAVDGTFKTSTHENKLPS
jgi:hypothetical protein